jgi:hypothetical protein
VRTTPATRPTSEPSRFQVREDRRALSAGSRRLSQSASAERTLDELTVLVSEKLTELGAGIVRFAIRSLPYEEPNWRIDTARLRQDEQAAVAAVSFELRSQYDLQMEDRPSPYLGAVSTCEQRGGRLARARGSSLVTKALMVATLSFFAESSAAEPLDLEGLPMDMVACKPAALRMCDRSQGYTAAALRKCGATLAARFQEIDQGCTSVLKRYGQL